MIKVGYKRVNGDYVFSKVAKEVEKYKKNNPRKHVVDLGVGDVKLPPLKRVCQSLVMQSKSFITSNGFCGYPPEEGLFELRKKISDEYRLAGCLVELNEIFITTGAKPTLGDLFEIGAFKKVAIITPTYPLYEELCNLHGVQVEIVEDVEMNGKVLPKEKVNALFLCSPNNPSGEVANKNGLKNYITYANNCGAVIVLDGAYANFSSGYVCPFSLENSQNVIEVRSYSKNLSFTGLRLGYVVIKKENPFHGAFKRYLSLRSNGVNVIMQKTALSYYTPIAKKQELKLINYYKENARLLRQVFEKNGYNCFNGQNTPYVLVNVGTSGENFFSAMLNGAGVVVTPGEPFLAKNTVRLSCLNTHSECLLGSKRIDDFLKNR